MALPSNTQTTYLQTGIRESLADVIYDISPVEVPFMSSIAQVEAISTLHEWQTDSLAAAASNAALDGDDAAASAPVQTVRLNNRTQISTKTARVSGTGRAVDAAGRADELDYQTMKRGRELRRDMETALLANTAKAAGNASTARTLAGVPTWIATNTDADGADPTGDGSDTATNGTQRAFTEAQLKTVLVGVFNEGGMPDCLMVGPYNRQIASSFADGKTVMQKADDNTLHATFDVYASDFGALKIIPNRFMRARDALVLQMDMWAVAFLPGRNMATHDIAKTGDSDARQVLSEYTLEARNEKANGIVRDLTTS